MKTIRMTLPVSLIVLVVWLILTVGVGLALSDGRQSSIQIIAGRAIGVPWLLAAAFVFGIAWASDRKQMGLRLPSPASSLRLVWLPLLYVVMMVVLNTMLGLPSERVLLVAGVNMLLVGLSEELMFRSILFAGLLSRFQIWPAILLTSFTFGLVHSLNAFTTGQLDAALLQSFTAFMQGLAYLAIRIRTGSVWPMVVVHSLWDFSLISGILARPAVNQLPLIQPIVPLLFALPIFLYGLLLLRRASQFAETHAADGEVGDQPVADGARR